MIELLAPAGGREALVAAVQNGANAIYLGTGSFNARRSADNFAGDALDEAVAYCHARNVKVHVTLNTMVRQDEYADLVKTIEHIYASGADAVLVQDFGVAEMCRRLAPDLALHASTQMAVHNAQGVRYLKEHGFTRAVLAREMEFEEIRACKGLGVELEAFAHGALCVSCSGQCLFSAMIGGRSGNRGMCAQPCRLPYRMNGKEGYLLSTRDLMTLDLLDRFREAGVDSLKLEGRLKRPEYVAIVTRAYRRALDGEPVTEQDVEELRQIFNRGGFTRGYAPGAEEKTLMYPVRPNHAGVVVGKAERRGRVKLFREMDASDVLALRGKGEDRPVKLAGHAGEDAACAAALPGDQLIRLTSAKQMRDARDTYQKENCAIPLMAKLCLKIGQTACLTVTDGTHTTVSEGCEVSASEEHALDQARIEGQIRKTGGTPYALGDLEIEADEQAFLPYSELNRMRRDALEQLTKLRTEVKRKPGTMPVIRETGRPAEREKPVLRAQSGSVKALRLAREKGADELIFAPEDMRRLDDALDLEKFYLALPQVTRQEELDALHRWAQAHQNRLLGVYLSNVGQLALDWPGLRVADYPLNIASNRTIDELDAAEYSPSVELNAGQIALLDGKKDLIVYGYLPLMQLRHCPRRASEGIPGKHRDCRMCDQPGAKPLSPLIDRTVAAFALRRIAYGSGCVLQILNSVPMLLLRHLNRLPSCHAWRLLVDENDAADVTELYRAALDGKDFRALPQWAALDGVKSTTGHYFRGVE